MFVANSDDDANNGADDDYNGNHCCFFVFPDLFFRQTNKQSFNSIIYSFLHNMFRPSGPGHMRLSTGQNSCSQEVKVNFVSILGSKSESKGPY